MKTTTRKLTFKKASLISAIIAGIPFLVLLIYLFCTLSISMIDKGLDFDVTDVIINIPNIVFGIFWGCSSLAWMISCIVFSLGIIRDGEHFPSIPKWVWCVLRIWTFLFAVFFLLFFVNGGFATTEDIPCWLSVLMFFAGLVLCFHYMIWFWYLFKRPSSNTAVSVDPLWVRYIARVTIVSVIVFTILELLVAVPALWYRDLWATIVLAGLDRCFRIFSIIVYIGYIIIAPFFLSLCLFLQPIINRCANKKTAVTDSEQATDNAITDGDTEQNTEE